VSMSGSRRVRGTKKGTGTSASLRSQSPCSLTTGRVTRRELLGGAAAAAAALLAGPRILSAKSPTEKLNIASIGCGGRGGAHLAGAARENLVALVDVDASRLDRAAKKYRKAKKFSDYRKMFDAMGSDIDAVIVATPDHSHAAASMAGLRLGKHVYCEKPLTHSIHEARALREEAARRKVATQMGNQAHAAEGYRLLCEWIWDGAIGPVLEAHAWTDRPAGWWPQGVDRPTARAAVPKGLDWDLWLGPASERAYHPKTYHPFAWRGWFDFGTGALGDMGCHIMDGAFWALKLGAPTSVAIDSSGHNNDSYPAWSVTTYQFPARGRMAPCKLVWYDAKRLPPRELAGLTGKQKYPANGSLFVGTKGKILISHGGGPRLLPEALMADYKRADKTIPRSRGGHFGEWISACKGGRAAMSHFGYSGPLTEMVLLGSLAQRVGKRIEWDAKNLKVTNVPQANQYVHREYRKGWTL
jgi:predicted dehydrogenase